MGVAFWGLLPASKSQLQSYKGVGPILSTTAKILKYKVHNSAKKVLLVGNGSPAHCFGIELNKVFRAEDAQRIVEVLAAGRF